MTLEDEGRMTWEDKLGICLGREVKGHGRAGHSGESRDRREGIGGGEILGDGSRERREVIGGGDILGRKRRFW